MKREDILAALDDIEAQCDEFAMPFGSDPTAPMGGQQYAWLRAAELIREAHETLRRWPS